MREYGVTSCSEECGETRIGLISVMYGLHWWHEEIDTVIVRGGERFCPSCGTRVGIDERGPWREAMVPRAALEWAVHKIDGCVYRDGRECAVVESGEENEDCFDGICFEHRMQAALKAAEEATQSE